MVFSEGLDCLPLFGTASHPGNHLIETWLDYKRTKEVDEVRLRPHPHEFFLYYDA